jgi:hypothetical protein
MMINEAMVQTQNFHLTIIPNNKKLVNADVVISSADGALSPVLIEVVHVHVFAVYALGHNKDAQQGIPAKRCQLARHPGESAHRCLGSHYLQKILGL